MPTDRMIWALAGGLAALAALVFFQGWGSSIVHILGVLVVMLGIYQFLRRRGAGPS
ncbi:MAG TPA: hypothetical protein VM536_10380 [Chloroflexia bacterium]|nr:hypothetical protein [Chloroflexia bacterium]